MNFKPSRRHREHHRLIKEYTHELGLRTHRPSSEHDDDRLDSRDERDDNENWCSQPDDHRKNHPLRCRLLSGDDSAYQDERLQSQDIWWKVPSPIKNYQQQSTRVSVAYSATEIYSKARIKDESSVHESSFNPWALKNETAILEIPKDPYPSKNPEDRPDNDSIVSDSDDDWSPAFCNQMRNTLVEDAITSTVLDVGEKRNQITNQSRLIGQKKSDVPVIQPHVLGELYDRLKIANVYDYEKQSESDMESASSEDVLTDSFAADDFNKVDSELTLIQVSKPSGSICLAEGLSSTQKQIIDNHQERAEHQLDGIGNDLIKTSDCDIVLEKNTCADQAKAVKPLLQMTSSLPLDSSAAIDSIRFYAKDMPQNKGIDSIYHCDEGDKLNLANHSDRSGLQNNVTDRSLDEELLTSMTKAKSRANCSGHVSKVVVPPIDLSLLSPKKSSTAALSKSQPYLVTRSKDLYAQKPSATTTLPDKEDRIANDVKEYVIKRSQLKTVNKPLDSSCISQKFVSDNVTSIKSPTTMVTGARGYQMYKEMTPRIESGDVSMWQCLPDEIWLEILVLLTQTDLTQYMLVCKDFHRISQDVCLWKSITVNRKSLSDADLYTLGRRQPMSLLLNQCTGQKVDGNDVTNEGMKQLFSDCGERLKELTIKSCVVLPLCGDVLLLHASLYCACLQYLDISWCNITDREAAVICSSFPLLTSLLLNGNQLLTDKGITEICSTFKKNLTRIELFGCFKITDKGVKSIEFCQEVTILNLGQCYRLSKPAIVRIMQKLPHLKSLNIKGLKQIDDNCIRRIVKDCPTVVHLNMSHCSGLTSNSLIEVACSLVSLLSLDVSSCKESVTDTAIVAVTTNCPSLETLDISSSTITNLALTSIAENCKNLLELKINFCSVTENSVRVMIDRCKSLLKLQLYGLRGAKITELKNDYPNILIEI